jgi:hypothetical protein
MGSSFIPVTVDFLRYPQYQADPLPHWDEILRLATSIKQGTHGLAHAAQARELSPPERTRRRATRTGFRVTTEAMMTRYWLSLSSFPPWKHHYSKYTDDPGTIEHTKMLFAPMRVALRIIWRKNL